MKNLSLSLWLPTGALVVVSVALVLMGAAYALTVKRRWTAVAMFVTLTALLIRGYASADRVLHPWDERYHVLVAKNLIETPLVPRLYHTAILPYDHTNWTGNHVWLHKPPLALWLQAASMKMFGVDEFSLKVPSLLFGSLSVAVSYAIATILFSPSVGLLAAAFHAFNGFLVDLGSGRRASDHVDTLLIFLFELGILLALVGSRRNTSATGTSLGVVGGLAYMTKSFSGVLLLPVWVAMRTQIGATQSLLKELAVAASVAAVIAAPWTIYTGLKFPVEAAYEGAYALRHMTEVLEEQGGPPWQYLWDMPRYFGELVYVPVAIAVWSVFRRTATAERRAIVMWIAVPYLVFSMCATKMPSYVMVAAPALFILQADVWMSMWQHRHTDSNRHRRLFLSLVLFLLAILPARYLLGPTGPLEERERNPKWVQDLRDLNEQIGAQPAVIFNIAHNVEAMFYTPYIAYDYLPTAQQTDELRRRGYFVYVFDDGSVQLPPMPRNVTVIRPDRN